MFAVVFFFVASRSLGESCGEICGGAGLAGVGSAVSVDAGRRGAAGRLPGAGGGAGDGTSGAGSSVVLTGGGVSGGGMGEVSSGGGALTDGGAARTMCLLAHPARRRRPHRAAREVGFSASQTPRDGRARFPMTGQRGLHLASQRQSDPKRRAASNLRIEFYRTIV